MVDPKSTEFCGSTEFLGGVGTLLSTAIISTTSYYWKESTLIHEEHREGKNSGHDLSNIILKYFIAIKYVGKCKYMEIILVEDLKY